MHRGRLRIIDLSKYCHRKKSILPRYKRTKKSIECLFCDSVTKRTGQRQNYVSFPQSEAIHSKSKRVKKKDNNYVNCTELASKLGENVCIGLPAFHAFTGCDYTAAFFNKGKVQPFKIFASNDKFPMVFKSLTDPVDVLDEKKIDMYQEFTAPMYGVKKCRSVNVDRHHLFLKMYAATKSDEKFIRNIKG